MDCFYTFGCICYIIKTKDQSGKFDSKVDKGTFLRYSKKSKAYRVYPSGTLIVEETINVKFDNVSQTNRILMITFILIIFSTQFLP